MFAFWVRKLSLIKVIMWYCWKRHRSPYWLMQFRRSPPTIHRPPSSVYCSPSTIHRQPYTVCHPSSAVFSLLSTKNNRKLKLSICKPWHPQFHKNVWIEYSKARRHHSDFFSHSSSKGSPLLYNSSCKLLQKEYYEYLLKTYCGLFWLHLFQISVFKFLLRAALCTHKNIVCPTDYSGIIFSMS